MSNVQPRQLRWLERAAAADEDVLVYWWNEIAGLWHQLSWASWVHSRSRSKPLPGVHAGDTRFAVCVVDDDGSIANVIPHRYMIDDSGYPLGHPDYPMTKDDKDFWRRHFVDPYPSEADCRRWEEINERDYRWSLPSAAAVRALLRTLPTPPSMNPEHGIWSFAAAGGGVLASRRRQ
jgi:hypothetical protein